MSEKTVIDLDKVSFKMPIDDFFEDDDFIGGVLITGHIETGTIKPNSTVLIVDTIGNIKYSVEVNGIIYQGNLPIQKKELLDSASADQDDYWGIGLIFYDKEVLNHIEDGMLVIME